MQRRLLPISILLVCAAGAAAFLSSGAEPSPASPAQDGPRRPKTWAPEGKRERLTPDDCVVVLVDHQTGLMNLVHDERPTDFKNVVVGLAKTARLFRVPVVITTSAESGPNGPYLPEVLALLPDAARIARQGQIDAFDDARVVEAVRKTGRKKIVLAGITTDVCVAFAALSALESGYEVYVVVDASGSMNQATQDAAIERMSAAGATIGTWFALSCELLSDWRHPEGAGSAQIFVEHLPSYAEIFHSHAAQTAKPAAR